jgi:hypothetical protein
MIFTINVKKPLKEKMTRELYFIIKFIDSFIFVVEDKENTTT